MLTILFFFCVYHFLCMTLFTFVCVAVPYQMIVCASNFLSLGIQTFQRYVPRYLKTEKIKKTHTFNFIHLVCCHENQFTNFLSVYLSKIVFAEKYIIFFLHSKTKCNMTYKHAMYTRGCCFIVFFY